MEIKLTIDDQYMKELKKEANQRKNSVIISEALALYKWAAQQRRQGKKIVSMKEGSDDKVNIVLPGLYRLSPTGN